MSSGTWTASALRPELRPLAGAIWRVVEAQHRISTAALVDSAEEQVLLEEILEETKPPYPQAARNLHYLLKTPFRYDAPYPTGSRFRRAGRTPGVFYASEHLHTALAEMAYHRVRFHSASPDAPLPDRPVLHTAFSVSYGVCQGLDLTRPPLDHDRALWTHPTDYQATQALADEARGIAACALRHESVRDPRRRANVTLLTPEAFAESGPRAQQTWSSLLRPGEIALWRTSGPERLVLPLESLRGQ